MKRLGLGLMTLGLLAGNATAAWGLKYEVYNGTTWTNTLTVNVAGGPVDVNFRMSVWNDGKSKVNVYKNGKVIASTLALQPLRVQVSSRISNWGTSGNGDQLMGVQKSVNSAGADAFKTSMAVKDTILGVSKGMHSFLGNLQPVYADYSKSVPSLTYFTGTMRIGNGTAAAKSRTIKFAANTLAAPSPTYANGGAYGASFYTARKPADIASGIATTYAVNYYSLITVVNNPLRPAGAESLNPPLPTSDIPSPATALLLPVGFALISRRRRS